MKSNLFAELFPALFLLGCADVEDSTIPPERVSEVRLGSDGGGAESTPGSEKPEPKDLGCGKTCYDVPGHDKRFCVDNPCDPYVELFDPSIPRVQSVE